MPEHVQAADIYLISVGELSETAFLRKQSMLSAAELRSVRPKGAVADSHGRLFDTDGTMVDHELAQRTLAFEFERLRGRGCCAAW